MKYIFLGTPEFAAIILKRLLGAGLTPLTVVTNPDRPLGRKQLLTPPPVKRLIIEGRFPDIDILQPDVLDQSFIEKLKSYEAEVFVLAAYGKILPPAIVRLPPRGIVGVHPSLLPRYRGATPIQNVLLMGENTTGATLFLLDERVDHGPLLAASSLPIADDDNYETLSRKLAMLSADLLIKTLPEYLSGGIKPRPQVESLATSTGKFKTEDGLVDLKNDSPESIWRKVRALNPEPGVYAIKDGRRLKILEADFINGELVLKKIQWEGEKPKVIG